MWWASGERQHVFVDFLVTQQGLRPEVGVGGRRRLKRGSGGGWREVKVAPGSSYFPSRGPAEVRRVTERELVSLSVLHTPCALIGWPESVLSLAASCKVRSQRGWRTPSCRLWTLAPIHQHTHHKLF